VRGVFFFISVFPFPTSLFVFSCCNRYVRSLPLSLFVLSYVEVG
jgi:hypothetical protein